MDVISASKHSQEKNMKKRSVTKKTDTKLTITDYIKKENLFTNVKEIHNDKSKTITSFTFSNNNLTAEIHYGGNFSLFRMTNLFNFEKVIEMQKLDFDLLKEANEFNRISVGIKCCIRPDDEERKAYFRIEMVIPANNNNFLSGETMLINSSILAGAPSLFINNIKK